MINKHPKHCNLCGGPVIYTSNAKVYGREYGSGKCYYCTKCGSYTGTHKPRPREALGLLADERMRKGKMACHGLFDPMWKGKPKAGKKRQDLYCWLAEQMGMSAEECHFGYFDLQQLRRAYKILLGVQDKPMMYDNCGRLRFDGGENNG
nr:MULTISPECIES: zinc-finger-containing protein [unclassified Pseudoflavonifractor]